MGKDWDAVAKAINTRMDELDMTQQELAVASGVSTATLRELQHNKNPRRRSVRLMEAISSALSWPPAHLSRVLEEGVSVPGDEKSIRGELHELRDEVTELRARIEALESERTG